MTPQSSMASALVPRWLRLEPARHVRDRDFIPALESIETPRSPIQTSLMLVICALFAAAVFAACFGKTDIYAVAEGKVQSIGRSKIIQPMDPGRVSVVNVKNGARVRQGDLLIELDPTETAAQHQEYSRQADGFRAEIARRKTAIEAARARSFNPVPTIAFESTIDGALRSREAAVLDADLGELRTTLASLNAKIGESASQVNGLTATIVAQERLIETLKGRLNMRQDLEKDQWESKANVLDAEEILAREMASLAEHVGSLEQAKATIVELGNEKDAASAKFIADNRNAEALAAGKLDSVEQEVIKTSVKVTGTRLLTPVDGTVQELGVTTIGQVVASGQQLMTIVPDDAPIEVEALVSNEDIGFVKVGQSAVVKVRAFPFTIYGSVSGTVVGISHDAVDVQNQQEALPTADSAVTPISASGSAAARIPQVRNLVFPITIALAEPSIVVDGRSASLKPGMSVTVEVKTGKRRIIDYLLSPLREIGAQAIHER
jgi:hemolysin D